MCARQALHKHISPLVKNTKYTLTFSSVFFAINPPTTMSDDDYEVYKKSSRFQRFTDEFRKQLMLFERAKEWADLIKCLRKLMKVCATILYTF